MMKTGDAVAIFIGARTPFVLRPTGIGSQVQYNLIGECYIYGIMDGESLQQKFEEQVTINLV